MAFILGFSLLFQPILASAQNLNSPKGNEERSTRAISPKVDKKASLKPKSVRVNLDSIPTWNPDNLQHDYINKGSVALKDRVKGSPINKYASEEGGILSLAYLIGNNPGKYSSVGDYEFNVNTFDMWQYVKTQVFWDGPVPTPDVIDAAHKNGVPILGTLFFNWSTSYEDNNIFRKFLEKDDQGKYPAARKLAEIAVHYGFDGYFFNQETTGSETHGRAKDLRNFILEMKEHAKTLGLNMIVSWYDAMNNAGSRAHYDAVNSLNDIWMTPHEGKIVADEFFANFNWTGDKITNSKNHLESIGRSVYDMYVGFELQKDVTYQGVDRSGLIGPDKKLRTSIGLFIPDTINGKAKTPDMLHDTINMFWTGENRDPSNIDDSYNKYNGMARYVVDTTPILQPSFYTSFNTGHGHYWFQNGKKTVTQDWNARSVQDVLPTWTWWMKSDKDHAFKVYYDFEDAYNGGSSVKVYGDIEAWSTQELMLYSTDFEVVNNTNIELTYKGGVGTTTYLNVYTDDKYQEQYRLGNVITETQDEWKTVKFDLNELIGKKVKAISLSFENTGSAVEDYKLNLGELIISTNETKPSTPENFKIVDEAIKSGTDAELIVKFDRVDGAYRYDLYRVDENDNEVWLNSSSSNMIYVPRISRAQDGNTTTQNLKVYAVGENGKVSDAAQTVFDWKFSASETTPAKEKAKNITPQATLVSVGNPSKAKLINDTLIDLTDKWWSASRKDNVVIEFDQPRTVVRWRIEHAGHAGESVNDGKMNTKDFNLEYMDENGQWQVADPVRGNRLHVTDRVLDTPITAKKWKFNVITRDNGTPWGGIRVYNWKMYETLDTESDNIPMTSADTVNTKNNLYTVRFNKEKLSRFYDQNMQNFTMRLYRDSKATDLIAEKTFDENGNAMFTDIELNGESGNIFYRTQEKGKEESNILVVSYKKDPAVQTDPDPVPVPELKDPFENGVLKIVSIDAGRKYFSVEKIKEIISSLAKNDYNTLHLLLGNDGLRFLLDDMTVKANGKTYQSEDVKNGILKGNQAYADAHSLSEDANNALTQAEMDEIFAYAKQKNIEIIPAINSPGHMDAILVAMKELGINDPNFVYNGVKSVTTLDIDRDDVKNFTQELIQLYINYFKEKGIKIFNFGADEYANDAFKKPGWPELIKIRKYDKFVEFANNLSDRIVKAGIRPMAFNDGFYYQGSGDVTFNKHLIIALWTGGWWGFDVAPSNTFIEKGHDVINVNDSWYYVVGHESSGLYNRQQAIKKMKSKQYPFTKTVSRQIETKGSMIALWNDNPASAYEFDKFEEWANAFAISNPTYFTIRADKDKLQQLVDNIDKSMNEIVESSTEESVAKLKEELAKAKAILAKPDASQEEINAEVTKLKNAFDALEAKPEEPVNKDVLVKVNEMMKHVISDFSDKYTQTTLKALEAKTKEADTLIAKDDATQAEIDQKVNELFTAFEALEKAEEVEQVDKTQLQSLIEKIESHIEKIRDKVTTESLERLNAALTKAKEVLGKQEATQVEVDNEINLLLEAFARLEMKPEAEKEALKEAIKKAEAKLTEDLEDESRTKLEKALNSAKEMLNNKTATQEEVNSEVLKLTDAIVNAMVKPQEPEHDDKATQTDQYIHGYSRTNQYIRDEKGNILGIIPINEKVEGFVVENKVYVQYKDLQGLIYKVNVVKRPVRLSGYTSTSLNIRDEDGDKVGTLPKGYEINNAKIIGNKALIRYNGLIGYVHIAFIKDTPPRVQGTVLQDQYVRDDSGRVVGILKAGSEVDAEVLNNKVKVTVNGKEGYIYAVKVVELSSRAVIPAVR